jgi:O-antigen ligase
MPQVISYNDKKFQKVIMNSSVVVAGSFKYMKNKNNKKIKNKNQNMSDETTLMQRLTSIYIAGLLGLLPLIVSGGYSDITATKSKSFYIMTIACIVFAGFGWLFVKFFDKQSLGKGFRKPGALDISALLFGVFTLMSSLMSDYQNDVWYGQHSRYQGCITILLYVVVYFVVSRNFSFGNGALIASAAAFTIVCTIGLFNCFDIDVLGIYSVIEESSRKICISTIGNVNFFSSYVCLLLPLVMCGFCQAKEKLSVAIYLSAVVMGTFGAMMTSSESFVAGFAGAVIIMDLIFLKDEDKAKRLIFISGTMYIVALIYRLFCGFVKEPNYKISDLLNVVTHPVVAIVILVVLVAAYLAVTKEPRSVAIIRKAFIALVVLVGISGAAVVVMANTILVDADFGALDKFIKFTADWGTDRGEIWRICIDLYKNFSLEDKLFGVGPETLYKLTSVSGSFKNLIVDQAHNEYLQHLMTIGLVGLMSYIAIVVSACVTAVKYLKNNSLGVAVFAGLVAYWIQAMFNIAQPFTTPIMYLYIACIAGLALKEKYSEKHQ